MKKHRQLIFLQDKNIPKIETKLEVKNETDSDVAELYLYGTIRQAYPWEDSNENVISSKRVRNALNDIKDKDLNIHINSGGGDVFESIAIHNTLKNHKGKVNVYVDSLAGSGASVIAMAGEKIYMPSNTMMMIHKAWTFASGNADDLRKQADDLDKIDYSVKESYKNKFVGTEEELTQLIADESWLTAEECLAFGLCDEILAEKKDEQKEPENNIKETLFNKYKKNIEGKMPEGEKVASNKATLFNAFKKQNLGGNE